MAGVLAAPLPGPCRHQGGTLVQTQPTAALSHSPSHPWGRHRPGCPWLLGPPCAPAENRGGLGGGAAWGPHALLSSLGHGLWDGASVLCWGSLVAAKRLGNEGFRSACETAARLGPAVSTVALFTSGCVPSEGQPGTRSHSTCSRHEGTAGWGRCGDPRSACLCMRSALGACCWEGAVGTRGQLPGAAEPGRQGSCPEGPERCPRVACCPGGQRA